MSTKWVKNNKLYIGDEGSCCGTTTTTTTAGPVCTFSSFGISANQHLRAPAGPSLVVGQYVTTSHSGQITDNINSTPPVYAESPVGLSIYTPDGTLIASNAALSNWLVTAPGQLLFRNNTDPEESGGGSGGNNNGGTHSITMKVCDSPS